MRSARATPAPPVVMAGYSARLALRTTLIGPHRDDLRLLLDELDAVAQRVKRVATGWVEVSWEEAFDEVEKNLKRIRQLLRVGRALGTGKGEEPVDVRVLEVQCQPGKTFAKGCPWGRAGRARLWSMKTMRMR